jgi:membrane protease YdiL (CAAX protease family)
MIVIVTLAIKVGLDCSGFCIGAGGGRSIQFPAFEPEVLGWIGVWLVVALTEELGFRGYVLREVFATLKWRRGRGITAVLISSGAFSVFHLALLGSGSGTITSDFLLQAFIAGTLFGLTYWLTDWNLILSVFLHFFYDAFGGVLNANLFDPLSAYRVIFVFILLPSLITIETHSLWKKARGFPAPQTASSIAAG